MFGSSIVIEQREDGHLCARYTPINGLSFPVDVWGAGKGTADLAIFHAALGDILAKMTDQERAHAYVKVALDDDGYAQHEFGYYRTETEDEYAERIAKEKADKIRYATENRERRRKLLEELKQEFEGESDTE